MSRAEQIEQLTAIWLHFERPGLLLGFDDDSFNLVQDFVNQWTIDGRRHNGIHSQKVDNSSIIPFESKMSSVRRERLMLINLHQRFFREITEGTLNSAW